MLIVILVIVGLSILILGHEGGHFLVAKIFGLKIDEFGFGFPPRIFAWRPKKNPRKSASDQRESAVLGETEYSLNWLPFGGFVRIAGENNEIKNEKEMEKTEVLPDEEKKRLFVFQPAWKRSLVVLAGVTVNFILGWFLLSFVLMIGTPPALVIADVQKNSPAAAAGIEAGDVVGNYKSADLFIKYIDSHKGESIAVNIKRGNEEKTFTLVPRVNTGPNEGAIGVLLTEAGMERRGFFASIGEGLKETGIIAWLTLIGFAKLLRNLFLHASLLEGVVGPVGIFSVAQETGNVGLIYLAQLVALISVNLAVINLIPFPALDGGRLLLIGIEKIKGSPVSRRTESWINGLGFAFLITLIALITARDVSRWF